MCASLRGGNDDGRSGAVGDGGVLTYEFGAIRANLLLKRGEGTTKFKFHLRIDPVRFTNRLYLYGTVLINSF